MKISGNGKGGNIVIRPKFEMLRIMSTLHPIFREPSNYAITLETARRLSSNPLFGQALRNQNIRTLDQFGDLMVGGSLKVYEGAARIPLKLYQRFIVDQEKDRLAILISDEIEMGPRGDRLERTDLLLNGEVINARFRTIDQHLVILRREGNVQELMTIANEGAQDIALIAIDQFIHFRTLETQKFLLDLSKNEDQRVAVRALHALAERGEAHDLVERIVDHGLRLADLIKAGESTGWDEFDLFVVMRSLARIELDNEQSAYGIFCRLNDGQEKKLSVHQQRLIMAMREDGEVSVKQLGGLMAALYLY